MIIASDTIKEHESFSKSSKRSIRLSGKKRKNHSSECSSSLVPSNDLSSKKNDSYGLYDSDRQEKIIDGLTEFYQNLPFESRKTVSKPISIITAAYEYNDSLDVLFEKVAEALQVTEEQKSSLTIANKNVLGKLSEIIMGKIVNKKKSFSLGFWENLMRLLFKIMIFNANSISVTIHKNEIETMLTIDPYIGFSIFADTGKRFPISFYPKHQDQESTFELLMNHEFLENSHLFPIFSSILEAFYIKGADCKSLESEYFNGSFDKNTLLKFLIIIHDSRGDLKKACFSKEEYLKFFSRHDPKFEIGSKYLNKIRSKGPLDFDYFQTDLLSSSMIPFILEIGERIFIPNSDSLLFLLRELKRVNLLKMELLERIVEFRSDFSKPFGWDPITFKDFLETLVKQNKFNKDIGIECQSYLDWFNSTKELKPLSKKLFKLSI